MHVDLHICVSFKVSIHFLSTLAITRSVQGATWGSFSPRCVIYFTAHHAADKEGARHVEHYYLCQRTQCRE